MKIREFYGLSVIVQIYCPLSPLSLYCRLSTRHLKRHANRQKNTKKVWAKFA